MNYASIKIMDVANGPGVRMSLFVSGCTHYCKGCFNKEAWDFNYGEPFTQKEIDYIIDYVSSPYVSGLTILGGEPMEPENQEELLKLTARVKEQFPDKDIWCFTGFTLEELQSSDCRSNTEFLAPLLSNIDILVDGRYLEELKNISLQFRGSENQRVIDLNATRRQGEIVIWKDLRR